MDFEVGIHLGNAFRQATTDEVVDLALAAEEHGFAAVWMTEHIVVEGDMDHRYANVVHPLTTLPYIAGRTSRIKLGTSIIVAPLYDPFTLAKLSAGIQAVSDGRFRLGVGAGWYEPEFRYMKREFARRGRQLDEHIALMRALWAGEREFHGEWWQCEDARFGPLPEPAPEVWVGGKSKHAAARAARVQGLWHPIELTAEDVARERERWPDLRIVPRVSADDVDTLIERVQAMREAGADGVAAGLFTGPAPLLERIGDLADATLPTPA
jgi:probable F420-dependent oxidoreductase